MVRIAHGAAVCTPEPPCIQTGPRAAPLVVETRVLAPVWAGLGVDAGVGDAEALDWASIGKVLLDNFSCVFRLDAPVPDGFGIHHNRGAVLALVKAKRFVDAHTIGQTRRLG